MVVKTVVVDLGLDQDRIDHWWIDFCVACGGSDKFFKIIDQYNIKIRNPRMGIIEVDFPDNDTYMLFRLRWS